MAALLLVGACGATAAARPAEPSALKVVATNTVLADLARNVVGERADVVSIIPYGADAHAFQTTPSDSRSIVEADLIISNGAGLDDYLRPVLGTNVGTDAVHIIVSEGMGVAPRESDGNNGSTANPHFWLNPVFAIQYVERIRDGLVQVDPERVSIYDANTQAYIQRLKDLDLEIAQTLQAVPPERRHLVTFHDSFGYFGAHYGWKVSSLVASDASDVSPGDIVRVMQQIDLDGIPAIFVEPQLRSDVMEGAAGDVGIGIGTIRTLVDATKPTYIEMMRSNAESLLENLR